MADNNSQATAAKQKKSTALRTGLIISGFAILILILALDAGYYSLLMTSRDLTNSSVQVQQAVAQTQTALQAAQKSLADLQQQNQQLTNDVKNQADALTEFRKTQTHGKEEFILTEAKYLVRIANDNLQFEHNVPLAIKLLTAADQELASLTDPNIYKVRQAISTDLAALQAATPVDVAGIYLKLVAVHDQLNKLPAANKFTQAPTSTETANPENLAWWRRALQTSWQGLQHIVIVRHNQANALPFITPDLRVFLIQNLHAQINQAQWALLHQREDVYRASLQQGSEWIKQYVTQDAQLAQQLLTVLAELQQIKVQPEPLTVENSLQAFQVYEKGK